MLTLTENEVKIISDVLRKYLKDLEIYIALCRANKLDFTDTEKEVQDILKALSFL